MKGLKILLSLIVLGGISLSEIPQLINYQGYLTDIDGEPITGTRSVEFLIYLQASGGDPVWQETQAISLENGTFSTTLGAMTPISSSLFNNETAYLAIKVGSDSEMVPRKQLTSVAYAFNAINADNLNGNSSDDFVKTGQVDAVTKEMVEDSFISSVNNVENDAGNIDLVAGDNIAITPNDVQNKITISASGGGEGDNLGNHTATQNILTNGHWISSDGGNEGIFVNNNGKVGIGTDNLSLYDPGLTINADKLTGIYSYGNSVGGRFVGSTAAIQSLGRIWAFSGGEENPTGEFYASNDDGDALYAEAQGKDGHGLFARASGEDGIAVKGLADNIYGDNNMGGAFRADGSDGIGIFAGGTYLSAYLSGDVELHGTLSKSAGSFKIDHPQDPENKYLQHSFVESPDMKNVYDGIVILDSNGEAVVQLPDYFESLNIDYRYQLTAIGAPGPNLHVAAKINNNQFKIAGGEPGMEVSWQVTGIRNDVYARNHRIEVEVPKKEKEQGKYIFPKDYDKPESMGIDYEKQQRLQEQRWKEESKLKEEQERMEQNPGGLER